MASLSPSFGSRVYTSISIALLTGWTLTALAFSALDLLNQSRKFIEPIASISLLTFLACRMVVFLDPSQKSPDGDQYPNSIAHRLTTGYRQSRRHALAMLLFSAAWLYEIAFKAVIMFFTTVFGGVMAAAIYNDAFQRVEETVNDPVANASASDLDETSLAQIEDFKDMAGFDPVALFKMIPPQVFIYCAALAWVNLAALTIYVLRISWRSIKVVFGSVPVAEAKK